MQPEPLEARVQSFLFGGRYRADALLRASRGLATWRGLDLPTGRQIILKVTSPDGAQEGTLRRAEHEAAVLREVRHPSLGPPLYGGWEGGFFCLVVPILPGVTLEQCLQRRRLSISEVLTLGEGLLAGLQEIHERGVLHRNIKPSNILVDEGVPLTRSTLVDFGLTFSDRLDLSRQPIPVGAVRYLSPEQADLLDAEVGPPSDLYSVGVVLFECLAGRPPFEGNTLGELLRQHLTAHPELGPPVPRALGAVVRHLMQKEPRDRYQTARGALEDLREIASALERGIAEPGLVPGTHDRRATVAEPSFVGREAALAALDEARDAAARGQGELVLVEGESGLGKTRLLDELARRGQAQGALVLRGQGADRAALRPLHMLAPVLRGVLAVVRERPELIEVLRRGLEGQREAVCEAAPQLAETLGWRPSGVPGPEALAEHRTLRALATLLDTLGRARPPVLVLLDDCQWADELTLKLLATWRWLPVEEPAEGQRHVTVVAAFNAGELPREHPLRHLEADRHVEVTPFRDDEIRQFARSMLGDIPETALELIVRLAEGNAFMASALVRGLVESGTLAHGPSGWQVESERLAEVQSSREAASFFARRLDLLPPDTRRVLEVSAILGREFDASATAALAGQGLRPTIEALEEAHRRHLLWAREREVRYTFIHDKLRQALLGLLSPEEARELHRRAALNLERRSPERVFELSYHFDAAGEPARALPYALAAAEQARQRHALGVAAQHYRIAERGAATVDAATRQRVAEGLGDVLMFRGEYEGSTRSYELARDLASRPLDRARLEGRLGELALSRWDQREALEAMRRGLRILGRRVPRGTFALTLGVLAALFVHALHTWLPRGFLARRSLDEGEADLLAVHLYSVGNTACWTMPTARWPLVLWIHLRRLNLAERYPPTPELAMARSNHAPLLMLYLLRFLRSRRAMAATLARAERFSREALEMLEHLPQPRDDWARAIMLFQRGLIFTYAAKFAEALGPIRESARLWTRVGDRTNAGMANTMLAVVHLHLGELPAVEKLSPRLLREGLAIQNPFLSISGLRLWAFAGGPGNAPREQLEAQLARPDLTAHHRVLLLQAKVSVLLKEGRGAEARKLLEALPAVHFERGMPRHDPLIELAAALRLEATETPPYAPARRAALLRRASAAARRALRLYPPHLHDVPQALRERGLSAAMRRRPRLARRCLDESLDFAERHQMRQERALTLLARGEVGRALGWPDNAADLAAGAEAMRALRPSFAPSPSGPPLTLSLMERFPRVLDAGRQIASTMTREATFAAVQQAALELLRGEECRVTDLQGGGPREEPPEGLCQLAAHRAAEEKRPVVLSEDPSGPLAGSGMSSDVRSALCAPILVRGKVAACFCVTHRELSDLFGEEEQRIAEFIATLAGAALENARGFAEVAQLSEERGRMYRQAQEALHKRDEFLSIASHELKTPLTSLKLQLQSLLHSLRTTPANRLDPARWASRLEVATTRVQRFDRLVDELLDLSHLAEGKLALHFQDVDLSALAAEGVERHREALAQAESPCSLKADGPVVGHWDRLRLEEVIDSLLSNAVKYGAGKLIEVSVEQRGGVARLSIRDHGMGIAQEDQVRIFERFERAVPVENYGGFGIGLWISREVVQALGGRISVQSVPGEGATFTVELPLAGRSREALH